MTKKQINDGLIKTIQLYPTEFCVDIWICNNQKNLSNHFHNRYGASEEFYFEDTLPNQVAVINATDLSELKGETRIVMNVNSFDTSIIVHELNHVFYHLCKILHVELTFDNQEWHSYMLEYMFNNCKDDGTFKLYQNGVLR
jgi:hypothetical protein